MYLDDLMMQNTNVLTWWESRKKKKLLQFAISKHHSLGKIFVKSESVVLFEEPLHLTSLVNWLSHESLTWLYFGFLIRGFACWRVIAFDLFYELFISWISNPTLASDSSLHAKRPLLSAACFLNFYLDRHFQLILDLIMLWDFSFFLILF